MSSDDTPDTKRRGRRTPLVIASMAAAVLLAGGGAAYWSSTATGGADDDERSRPKEGPPPLALAGHAEGRIAPGEPDPHGTGYRAVGKLPDGPGTAPVYRASAKVGEAEVARLAWALKVTGKVRSDGATWKVGGLPRGARDPVLQVAKGGTGSWTYTRYGSPAGTGCAAPGSPVSPYGPDDPRSTERGGGSATGDTGPSCPSFRGGGGGGGGKGGDSALDEDGEDGGAVSREEAERAVRPVLDALGQRDARLTADGVSGAVRTVRADPVLDGLATYGRQSDLQVGPDGRVSGGSGQLARPIKGAGYPVLGARDTLDRLNRSLRPPRAGDCASAEPYEEGARAQGATARRTAAKGSPVAPCEPAPGGSPRPAEVTGAVFGLSAQIVDGQQALVPSWLFEVRPPGAERRPGAAPAVVAHPAVHPDYLVDDGPGGGNGGNGGTTGDDPATQPPSGPPDRHPSASHPSDDGAYAMGVESYEARDGGRTLVLRFWGGVCSSYATSVEQSGGAVRARVTGEDDRPGRACVKIAKEFTRTVGLQEPLGERAVIDASSGETVPERAPDHS